MQNLINNTLRKIKFGGKKSKVKHTVTSIVVNISQESLEGMSSNLAQMLTWTLEIIRVW